MQPISEIAELGLNLKLIRTSALKRIHSRLNLLTLFYNVIKAEREFSGVGAGEQEEEEH